MKVLLRASLLVRFWSYSMSWHRLRFSSVRRQSRRNWTTLWRRWKEIWLGLPSLPNYCA